MSFRRWYDADPRLSAVVHAMEDLNPDSQTYFAAKLLELSNELLAQKGGQDYLASLEPKKQDALSKSSAKKRWYDRNETLHQAFNNLYALPAQDRRQLASQLETPIQIVEGYEKHCARQDSKPERRIIEEILSSTFVQGQARARRLYSLYLHDYSEMTAHQQAASQKSQAGEPEGMWSLLLKRLQEALVS